MTAQRRHGPGAQPATPIPAITLGDLAAAGVPVECVCNRCNHAALVDSDLLVRKVGPTQPVSTLVGRLRCTACAARDVHVRPAWRASSPKR